MVIAVDGSAGSEVLVQWAAAKALRRSDAVLLLHSDPASAREESLFAETALDHASERLAAFLLGGPAGGAGGSGPTAAEEGHGPAARSHGVWWVVPARTGKAAARAALLESLMARAHPLVSPSSFFAWPPRRAQRWSERRQQVDVVDTTKEYRGQELMSAVLAVRRLTFLLRLAPSSGALGRDRPCDRRLPRPAPPRRRRGRNPPRRGGRRRALGPRERQRSHRRVGASLSSHRAQRGAGGVAAGGGGDDGASSSPSGVRRPALLGLARARVRRHRLIACCFAHQKLLITPGGAHRAAGGVRSSGGGRKEET